MPIAPKMLEVPEMGHINPPVGEPITQDQNEEGYAYFMSPEPKENLGPIRMEHDDIFGREVKVRDMRIGMVRNASEENRKDVVVYLEPYPHTRIDKAKDLQGWYQAKDDPKAGRPRPCFTEAILTQPYGGACPVQCCFCYINAGGRGYRGSGLITVPVNYGPQIKKQLSKMYRSAAGYFTSFHDPFNQLEEVYHNSQLSAQAFVDLNLPIFFLSRLHYPIWAMDMLMKNKHSYAQKSINTPSQEDWKKLSPGAITLQEHFDEITELHRRGIYVSIQCNPVIAGVTSNEQILELFGLLRKAGADHVIVKFVEAAYSWAPAMIKKMISRFGDRGHKFGSLFTCNIGVEKTVDETYRLNAHKLFRAEATRLGLTYSVCYEYRFERDEHGNKMSSRGVSIGKEMATSSQCHGQKVPIYQRENLTDLFYETKECPPSGCLHCAEDNGGKPRCGDSTMGKATALKLIDLKKPMRKDCV